jgi:hypothetical protein
MHQRARLPLPRSSDRRSVRSQALSLALIITGAFSTSGCPRPSDALEAPPDRTCLLRDIDAVAEVAVWTCVEHEGQPQRVVAYQGHGMLVSGPVWVDSAACGSLTEYEQRHGNILVCATDPTEAYAEPPDEVCVMQNPAGDLDFDLAVWSCAEGERIVAFSIVERAEDWPAVFIQRAPCTAATTVEERDLGAAACGLVPAP